MKIEMGESLFYSWLRHVKECQVVQTNWKTSPQWAISNEEELMEIMQSADKHFNDKYGYTVFKNNTSLQQLLRQAELDVLGISYDGEQRNLYAIDVAFHESGLNYGTREVTVMKVIEKCVRAALCLYGCFNTKSAEIVFASPKINPAVLNDILPCITDLNEMFCSRGFEFKFRIIANDDFNEQVLKPILLMSAGIADTSELFLRSYQMFGMFAKTNEVKAASKPKAVRPTRTSEYDNISAFDDYTELKISQIVKVIFRKILESGAVSDEELSLMQTAEYCKKTFDLQYAVLVPADADFEWARYYSSPLSINGKKYYLCSQWFETPANNDRPFLLRWIAQHQ